MEDLRQSRLHAIALGRVGDWREVQRVSWRPRGRGSRTRWGTNTRPRGGWPRGEQRAETLNDAVQRRRCTRGCGVEKAICRRRDRGDSAGGRPTSRRAVQVRPVNLGRTETRGPQHHRQSHARQSHARGLWEPPWTPGTPTTHVDTMFRRLRALASRSPGRIVDCEVVVARLGYFRVKNVSRGRTFSDAGSDLARLPRLVDLVPIDITASHARLCTVRSHFSASAGCSRRPPPRPASTVATRASTSTASPCCPRTAPCRTGDLSNETSSPVSRRGSSSTRRASFSPCSSSHAGWWSPRRTRSPALRPRAP